MLNHIQKGYKYMHLYMGYDGELNYQTSRTAIEEAKIIGDLGGKRLMMRFKEDFHNKTEIGGQFLKGQL